MKWTLSAFSWNDTSNKIELRAASQRKLSLKLRAPSTLAFTIDGMHPQAALVRELVTDVVVSCTPVSGTVVDLIRARCGPVQDQVGNDQHGTTFSFADYRQVLERRMLKAADTLFYNAVDQSVIAWTMIQQLQSRTNGNYAITTGVGATTGILRQKTLSQGTFVGKEIQAMSQLDNGFDWDINAAMALNVYFPTRGSNNGVGIEYGKSVIAFSRSRNPAAFANDDIVTGGQDTAAVEKSSATVGTDLEGRWDGTFSYPDIVEQPTLNDRAQWAIEQTSLPQPAYNVILSPEFWQGPAHVGLGDTVQLVVKHGRVNDNLAMRVLEINIDIGDDGSEQVRMILGTTPS